VKQASAVQIGDRLAMPSRTVTAIQPVMMTQRGQARQRPPTMLTLESRADDVLARYRVIGSVAGDYSLYDALDEARDQARRRGPQADRDVLQRQCDVCGRWDLALPGDRCRAQPPCRGVYQFR
jgi:hypothetical protein